MPCSSVAAAQWLQLSGYSSVAQLTLGARRATRWHTRSWAAVFIIFIGALPSRALGLPRGSCNAIAMVGDYDRDPMSVKATRTKAGRADHAVDIEALDQAVSFFTNDATSWHVRGRRVGPPKGVSVRDFESVPRLIAAVATAMLSISVLGCGDETEAVSQLQKPPQAGVATVPAGAAAPGKAKATEKSERPVAARATADEGAPEDAAEDDAPAAKDRRGASARRRTSAKRRTAKAQPAAGRARSQSAPGSHGPEPGAVVALNVQRLVVSRGIENREPVGAVDHVTLDRAERVYAFVELANPSRVSSRVQVRFVSPRGQPIDVLLEVGDKPRWRTWAFTRKVRQTGTWTVAVRSLDGAELASTQFEVTQ